MLAVRLEEMIERTGLRCFAKPLMQGHVRYFVYARFVQEAGMRTELRGKAVRSVWVGLRFVGQECSVAFLAVRCDAF